MIMIRTAILLAISAALATAQTTGTEQTEIVTAFATDTTSMNNMTTMANNMTTMAMTTSTPGPTPCSYTKWLVREAGGAICMLMDFNATLTYHRDALALETVINATNTIVLSTCSDTSAMFIVAFESKGYTWILSLRFTSTDNTYVMDLVGVRLTKDGIEVDAEIRTAEYFTVDNGQYYICDTIETSMIHFDVSLTNPIFQPFVQKTSEGCGLGLANECGDGESGKNTGLIVGCVFGAIIVLAAAGGMTYYIIRKKKKNSYSNL